MPLTVVASPIGNLSDLSPRASQALMEAEEWLVEDTRVSAKLQAHLNVKKPMRVLNDHTSEARVKDYLAALRAGAVVALLSDAGCPGVSDPGAMLVDGCREEGIEVDAIPGPSAVTTSLMLSGFFAQRFAFLGYLPKKSGDQRAVLAPFADSALTLVLFESPFRTEKLLEALFETLGARRFALCREMTKAHQQVYRNRLPNKAPTGEVPQKGEFTVVVEGKRRNQPSDVE